MNTIIGALIAALIAFVSGALALLSQDADVTQKAWIILGLGAFLNFLKDYFAIATRSAVNKVTGTGDGGGSGPLLNRAEMNQAKGIS